MKMATSIDGCLVLWVIWLPVFLVMDYAQGGELYQRLKEQPGGVFPERRAAKYIAQLIEALTFIHVKVGREGTRRPALS